MGKGQKLITSRSERLLGSNSYNPGQQNGGDVSELREADVWPSIDESVNGGDNFSNGWHDPRSARAVSESNSSMSNCWSHRQPPSADHRRQIGGLSLAFDETGDTTPSRIVRQYCAQESAVSSPRGSHMSTSAPVNVPDWSKIYRVDSVESLHESDNGIEDPDSEWLPPHEYLARANARNGKTAANSVFEGVGRTLKGRDMSRVRDAVWSQTGFYG